MTMGPWNPKSDRQNRDMRFNLSFGWQPNRAVIKRAVISGERTMEKTPSSWLVITPKFPKGISLEEWSSLSEDDRTDVARFWYISNYLPDKTIGPDVQGGYKTIKHISEAIIWQITNVCKPIDVLFHSKLLDPVGRRIECVLHKTSKVWIQAPRLEVCPGDGEIIQAIQHAAAGARDEYDEIEERFPNSPVEDALSVPELKSLLTILDAIVGITEAKDRDATEASLTLVVDIFRALSIRIAKLTDGRSGPADFYVVTHAISLYHRLEEFVFYERQFLGHSPFE